MVVGLTGTGKTTLIHTLARAMEQLNKEGSQDYYHKVVQKQTLNPKSVTMNELFGYTNVLTNEWTDGIVASIVRTAVTDTTDQKKWIIFDGPVDALWIENMNTVLDDNKMLCLNNGQRIKLPATFTMMFEVQDLAVASPATVSRCGMVYMEPHHLGWEPLVKTWGVQLREQYMKDDKVPTYVDTLIDKIEHFFKDNLKVVREEFKEKIPTTVNNILKSLLNLAQINLKLLTDTVVLEKMNKFDMESHIAMVLIFSYIWSAGANLHDSSRSQFSQYLKGKIISLFSGFPFEGDVYDYYCDYTTKEFKPWTEKIQEFKYNSSIPYFNILVPTSDTVKFKYLITQLIEGGFNILLSGETGTGKTVIINEYLYSLESDRFVFSTLNFSAQTSAKNLQDLFMDKDKFMKKKKDLLGPPAGRKMILFIDDVNMPALEKYGAQPPNELFRQIIDQGGFYDLKKLYFMYVKDCQFITACAPPGGGRNPVTPRLFRHFNQTWCPDLSQRSMEVIFTAILKGFLMEQNKGLDKFASYIVKSSVEIYFKITKELLPTPTKSHYTFNLRDLSKVIQGILQIRYDNLTNKEMLIQLWAHESQRVFQDRLVDDKDRDWFLTLLMGHTQRVFEFEWEKPQVQNLLFGDYSNANKDYIRIDNPQELPRKFQDFLNMYNASQKQMNLVFFTDAIMHLSRLCRILRQPRGNALLIGVGGSGRQSLTKLSAQTRGQTVFSIEITKNYKEQSWKDDLKRLLKTAGAKDQPVVFLFSDTQVVRESFLEDINNVLNTGEVPNLWATEDIEEIINDVRPLAKEQGLYDSRDVLLKFFVSKIRENLHIVLAFSPVGEKLRNRCRQFPSIINCCTIDWFDKWPDEALNSVAMKDLGGQEHLGIGDFVDSLASMSVIIHSDVKTYSERFYDELRRKNYVTPTSYLELLKLYIDMMKVQSNILPQKIKKYTVGLQTLKDTNEEVGKLQKKIIEFQPILEQSAKDNAKMMVELEGKSKEANATEQTVSKEAAEAQKKKDEVNEMRNSCQAELDQALPILEQAQKAVQSIDKAAINEMKALKTPPNLVQIVMCAVNLLFDEKEDWPTAQKVLGRMTFIQEMLEFDVTKVQERRLQKLKQTYLSNPDFTKEKIMNVSQAATTLLVWVVATEKFAQVKKVVGPKEKALKEAEASLKKVEQELAVKMGQLKEVQDMVNELKRNLQTSINKSEMLRQQQQTAEIQLVRAEKLVSGLASEAERWKVNAALLEEDLRNLVGNIMLAAGSIAYLGPFTYNYRSEIIAKWINNCKELSIPVSDNFTLQRILAEEVTIREWQEAGLPADNLSIDNGIFVFNCRRWPLIIDPQGQANKWIKALGKETNLQITKLSESNFLKTLENSIRFGQQVLMENVEEELDPSLEPILQKQIFKKGAQYLLRLGDQDIPYNNDFKLYFTTKLPNPHYIPEISIKTTIINFTVTPQGLEDQLLVEVVRQERIDLEEKRVNLILQISQDKRQLQELEDKILKLISEAQGRILEEEDLITTLDASKITSDTVNQRMAQSKVTAEEINQAREQYRIIARRGSVIYFVIADLALIDPMYQYSLEFFIRLFKKRLEVAPNPPSLEERLAVLIDDITKAFYINICRGLFEKDKLLFSFLIASKIQLQAQYIHAREWNIFLRGGTGTVPHEEHPSFLNEKSWKNCMMLSKQSHVFAQLPMSLRDSNDEQLWREVMDVQDPWKCDLPLVFRSLDPFQKLLLFKTLRDEKLVILIKNYVSDTLTSFFIEPPVFNLKGAFQDSSCTTPIIFVLSPGADPITYLLNLAKDMEMETKLKIISLGQGQGNIAKELIKTGRRTGDWVCLQNCHLAITWMPELERIQELQVEADTDANYRLWLTSMPTDKFPVPVLQSGIKLTNEPPKGLKANMMRTYNDISGYDSCTKQDEYKKLLFSLAFFHAVILERRKFGPIGWNIPYEWMNSDFETCQLQLKMYLDEQPEVPYQTLNYIISEINYGGRVTDDKDVRLITDLLKQYFCPAILNDPNYIFSSSGVYHPPQIVDLQSVIQYISSLPLEDDPEVFGLHANANITFQQKTVAEFMSTLLSVQPRMVAEKGVEETPDQIVFKVAKEILGKLPPVLVQKKEVAIESLAIFRSQEVDRFIKLVRVMKNSLELLQKAIQGLVVMSIELEKMFNSFLDAKVPENWENVAYPSLKPLGSWVTDLNQRLEFFKQWLENGSMKSYWLSAMFFPQGFMTATKQTYARKTKTPIDTLTFRTQVRPFYKDNIQDVPQDGVNIDGLYLQGCKWDVGTNQLEESDPLVLFQEMPVVWLEPVIASTQNQNSQKFYKCPLYKTSTRRGTLSTTGHSTNFVLYLELTTGVEPAVWTRRGVALLCQLDD
ncbi:unnamed protein product (macronuclear) [Paramecium tetraurelia]|uniref:Uncharacterized protein n=1 Tax=Paramecium tetraurelia TaxID=5888 RepID=A0DPS1_PARTE|nr:uncharacterized protein GSPATT00019220001 [Paramecium tetraurelia]CAK85038.1 unnamed protein product [Paramecium tetraurelia]|eukprot:XP_001452435.1 hypothetical protein (macronuclear) [Paramecium tetraurelia strain d4-2]